MPIQTFVGDVAAREVFTHEPTKFASIEALPHTGTHVPESLDGVLAGGQVRHGVKIPSGASLLPGYRPSTLIRGLDVIPAPVRPADRLVNTVRWPSISWWGAGSRCSGWPGGLRPSGGDGEGCRRAGGSRARSPGWCPCCRWSPAGWSPRSAANRGRSTGLLLTRDAVTTSANVWWFFTAALLIYTGVGTGGAVVLRSMTRRWASGSDEPVDVPYGPGGRGAAPEAAP